MISTLILIVCTTAVFGAPTQLAVSENKELILQNLSSEARQDYYQIALNDELTLAEMDEKLDKWAEKNGISDKWTTHTKNLFAREEKYNKTILTFIENLPSFDKMIKEIASNRNRTQREEMNAFHKHYERYRLELGFLGYLFRYMIENEEAVMNGRSICTVEKGNSTAYLTINEGWQLIFNNITSEAQEDYHQIWHNDNLTLAEIDEKFEKWVEKNALSEKWKAHNAKVSARSSKFYKIVMSVIENLPSVYRMYSEITTNRNQTRNDINDALDKLKETYCLEFEVILEIKQILIQNDEEEGKRKENGGNIGTGNEVLRKMRDSPINGSFKGLLLPGLS